MAIDSKEARPKCMERRSQDSTLPYLKLHHQTEGRCEHRDGTHKIHVTGTCTFSSCLKENVGTVNIAQKYVFLNVTYVCLYTYMYPKRNMHISYGQNIF